MQNIIWLLFISSIPCISLAQEKSICLDFHENHASLNYASLQKLEAIKKESDLSNYRVITIEAITAECSDMERARRLSLKRAQNIEAYLKAIDVNCDSIAIIEILPKITSPSFGNEIAFLNHGVRMKMME